jgi:hypothetical protein
MAGLRRSPVGSCHSAYSKISKILTFLSEWLQAKVTASIDLQTQDMSLFTINCDKSRTVLL